MTEIKKTCPVCGREFTTVYSYKKYCSKECYYTALLRRENEKHKPVTELYKKICPECGKEFLAKYKNRRYCSEECRLAVNRLNAKEQALKKRYYRCRKKHDNCSWCEYPDCIY